jgi:hypothetical protein
MWISFYGYLVCSHKQKSIMGEAYREERGGDNALKAKPYQFEVGLLVFDSMAVAPTNTVTPLIHEFYSSPMRFCSVNCLVLTESKGSITSSGLTLP